MTNDTRQTIFQFFTSKQVAALITIASLIAALFNVLIAIRLSPLASAVDTLKSRADAADTKIIEFVPRNELNATFGPIKEDIGEVKQDVKEIKHYLLNK